MHRFYLPPEASAEGTLVLSGAEAHHALHVMRIRQGERISVLDGAGRERVCEAHELGRDKLSLVVVEERAAPTQAFRMTLLQAIPKGKIMESIIQKATELGASRIVPLLSERVVAHMDAQEAAQKAAKWQRVAIEALKQCGAPWLPQIEIPVTPAQFLARKEPFELSLVASLQPRSSHPREHFRAFRERHGRNPGLVWLWVGPEGDLTPAEIQAIQTAGALPITLGPLVLRAETAATYCLSIVNYELS